MTAREQARDLGLDFVLDADVKALAAQIRPLIHHSRDHYNRLTPGQRFAHCAHLAEHTTPTEAEALRQNWLLGNAATQNSLLKDR